MMATVIDALYVTLGLKAAGFIQGQKDTSAALKKVRDEAQTTGKDLEEFGKTGAQFFSNIKTEALGLLGVLAGTAGLGAALSKTADSLVALKSASISIGNISPQTLEAVNMAYNRRGASISAATDAMLEYAKAAEIARLGGDQTIRGNLVPIGGSIEDSPLTFLQKAQKYVQDHINDPNGGALIQQTLGRIGISRELIDAMIRIGTVANMNREIAKSIEEIGVATKDQIEAAGRLQAAFATLRQEMDHAGEVAVGWVGKWLGDPNHPETWKPNPYDAPQGGPDDPGPWERLKQWWLGGAPPVANQSLAPHQQAFLQSLSKPESGGSYYAANVGGKRVADLTDLSTFPSGPGHFGRYQFNAETWQEQARKLGLTDFSPGSQDRAAWELAFETYFKATGRSLEVDLRTRDHDQDIARILKGRWPSVPGGAQSSLPIGAANYGALTPGPAARSGAGAGGASTPPAGAAGGSGGATAPSLTVGSLNIYGVQDPHTMGAKASQALAAAWVNQFNRGLA
jgi:muramidase (phage lysozyme)